MDENRYSASMMVSKIRGPCPIISRTLLRSGALRNWRPRKSESDTLHYLAKGIKYSCKVIGDEVGFQRSIVDSLSSYQAPRMPCHLPRKHAE